MAIWEMGILTLVISTAGGYLLSRFVGVLRTARKSSGCGSSCGCSNDSR